jgi:hypothetical protein
MGTPPVIVQAAAPARPATPHTRAARAEAARQAKEQAAEPPPAPQPPQPLQPPASKLAPHPSLVEVYTRMQLATGALPPDEFGERMAHSYSANGGWYVMLVPGAYQMNGKAAGTGTTHYSAWSYDRHVPLGFYGAPFQPGIFHGRVAPVDFAATFAALLGVNQPSASIGHILTQAFRPVATATEAPVPTKAPRGRRGAPAAKGADNTPSENPTVPDDLGGVTPE